MKVAVITPSLNGGGWIAFRRFIEVYSEKRDITWIITTLKTEIMLKPEVSNIKIKIYSIPFLDYDLYVHKVEVNPFWLIFFNLPLFLISIFVIFFETPEITIGNGPIAGFIGLISKIFGAKSYVWIHTDSRLSEKKEFLKKILLALFNKFDHIFVNSENVKEDLEKLGVLKKLITVIPNWVDDVFFEEKDREKIREKYRYSSDDFIALFVGRFVPYKHILTYLEAIKYSPCDIKFIFVGRGEFEEKVKKISKSYKNVNYLGYISDKKKLAEIYAMSDILLSWADETYMPLVALEAIASGTPVIYLDIPAAPTKYLKKQRIKKTILPQTIGWKLPPDPVKIGVFLSEIRSNISEEIRKKCKDYGLKYHSKSNVKLFENFF